MVKKKISHEEYQKQRMEADIRDMKIRIEHGILPLKPTRKFKVGERVRYGAHHEVFVRKIHEDGLFYTVEAMNVQRERDKPAVNELHIQEWHQLFPYNDKKTTFRQEESYYIRMYNSGIGSLLNMVYRQGVDFDVDYQREHVWELKDKIDLIDSIFNNIDIGKFVFIQRSWNDTRQKQLEILDGKQRLSALCEFYEDRFKYKGFYFSQLSNSDKNKFDSHGIAYGYLENPDKRAIFETFIKLNTCGKPMATKHINKVKKLLNEL